MKNFKIAASTQNLNWCQTNLADADWSIQENCSEITVFYRHDFQKIDILNAIEQL